MSRLHGSLRQIFNRDSEDYGTLAAATNTRTKYYCKSKDCCVYVAKEEEVYNKKKECWEVFKTYAYRERVTKRMSRPGYHSRCPDCGGDLFIR